MGRGDISQLAGFVPEPYRKDEVLTAARTLQPPFLLREVATATGLPSCICHRVLSRLVKQGILTRCKAAITFPQMGGKKRIFIPGGRVRRVYIYSFVEGR